MIKAGKTLFYFVVSVMLFYAGITFDAAFAADPSVSAPLSPRSTGKTKIIRTLVEQEARLDWLEEQNRKLVAVVNYLAQENDAKAAHLAKLEEDNEILRDHIMDLERTNNRRRR